MVDSSEIKPNITVEFGNYEDLVPNKQEGPPESNYADLIPSKTETPLPGIFSGRFTDKTKYIGDSDIQEDYEDITDQLGGFDRFMLQTIGGNEKVMREKKSEWDWGKFKDALLSRNAAAMVGAFGGYEGVKRHFAKTATTVFKRNPYILTASVIAGTLGATSFEQIHDRVKGFITGEEETIDEIWKKIPEDLKRNLSYEMLGVGLVATPYYIKKSLMKGGEKVAQLMKSVKTFGNANQIKAVEKKLKNTEYNTYAEKLSLMQQLKTLKEKNIELIPMDFAGNIAKGFQAIGGIFPWVSRPFVQFIKRRGENLKTKLDDTLAALGDSEANASKIGEDIVDMTTKQYLTFRDVVGKQYEKFLALARGEGFKNVDGEIIEGIKNFDVNIVPLFNSAKAVDDNAPDYLLDVARKIIKEAQVGGKNQLPENLQSEAYKMSLWLVKTFSDPQFIGNAKKGAIPTHIDVQTLRQLITGNFKTSIAKAEADGKAIGQIIELKNAINRSFNNMDLSKLPKEAADQITEQYQLANGMYTNGFMSGGKWFDGIDIYERGMGKQFEKVKKNIFNGRLTEQGRQYFGEWVGKLIRNGDKDSIKDLYVLTGKDDNLMGTFIRTYMDEAFQVTSKGQPQKQSESQRTFNFLNFDPNEFIKNLKFRDVTSTTGAGSTVLGKEEGITEMLNILNKSTDGKVISGKDFREFLNLLSIQGNIILPDVHGFIKRGAVFSGISGIMGKVLGPLFGATQGSTAGSGGLGLMTTLSGYQFSSLLANPTNTKFLLDSLDKSIPYFQRYSAALRVLEITQDNIVKTASEAADDQKEKWNQTVSDVQEFYNEALLNAPKEGDTEPPVVIEKEINVDEDNNEINVDEEIIIDEGATLNVPQPDTNFNMAAVIEPLPGPSSDRQGPLQLEDVGMPLFANQGGIASLIGNKKPQQMVA